MLINRQISIIFLAEVILKRLDRHFKEGINIVVLLQTVRLFPQAVVEHLIAGFQLGGSRIGVFRHTFELCKRFLRRGKRTQRFFHQAVPAPDRAGFFILHVINTGTVQFVAGHQQFHTGFIHDGLLLTQTFGRNNVVMCILQDFGEHHGGEDLQSRKQGDNANYPEKDPPRTFDETRSKQSVEWHFTNK
ncbi:hypothetical protein SRABI106_04322 [Rahnella aquatilis]|nr:hypothetical protein SRABI106_04322 [Rahnella aquatilis]